MLVHARFVGDVAVLSNFGRLLNDPRHFDAGRDVQELLDQGYRRFVLELGGIREMGPTGIGLLTTLTRLVRRSGGEAVLANPSPRMEQIIDAMKMDAYWEVFASVDEAREFLGREAN
jgi:anti-anti-sigma factor